MLNVGFGILKTLKFLQFLSLTMYSCNVMQSKQMKNMKVETKRDLVKHGYF